MSRFFMLYDINYYTTSVTIYAITFSLQLFKALEKMCKHNQVTFDIPSEDTPEGGYPPRLDTRLYCVLPFYILMYACTYTTKGLVACC